MSGVRARVRAELLDEIKRLAREQIARDGASNLSLRAISRELGMASSAIYRYYPSRDHLLTALIIDSYAAIGAAVEAAEAMPSRDDLRGRWRTIAEALRAWALTNPAEYGLIFGTPVPGYAAPPDTIGPASRYTAVLVSLLSDAHAAGRRPAQPAPIPPELSAQYDVLRSRIAAEIPDELLLAGLTGWMALFGAISLELFGHLHNVIDDPALHFAAVTASLADQILGTDP